MRVSALYDGGSRSVNLDLQTQPSTRKWVCLAASPQKDIGMFTLQYQLASPEEQKVLLADQLQKEKEERGRMQPSFQPVCNDAGYLGGQVVNNRMFKTWQVLASKLWDYLLAIEDYDSLVEEMQSPILVTMNHRLVFRNC